MFSKGDPNFRIALLGLATAVIGISVSIAVPAYFEHKKDDVDAKKMEYISDEKGLVSGSWAIKTITKNTDIENYEKIEIFYKISLNIDDNLNIRGTGFKIEEEGANGRVKYSKEHQSKIDVVGSTLPSYIYMTWDISDFKQRKSYLNINGKKVGDRCFYGNFNSDVGNQWVVFMV